MTEALDTLLLILKLEKIDECLYRGVTPKTPNQRVFGGQVFAQAMRAAQDTVVAERAIHSQQAYFLRPGDPLIPILYAVDKIRDGGSFTTRRVVASQRGKAIFSTSLSFQKREVGLNHQLDMPICPPPEELSDDQVHRDQQASQVTKKTVHRHDFKPIEMRSVEPIDYLNPIVRAPQQHVWLRAKGQLERGANTDSGLHQAVLAYASDYNLMSTALLPHATSIFNQQLQPASLDHAIWFHDDFRVDEWLLYAMDSPRASGSRGLNRGSFFSRDGRLVASTIQEGLMRIHPTQKPTSPNTPPH